MRLPVTPTATADIPMIPAIRLPAPSHLQCLCLRRHHGLSVGQHESCALLVHLQELERDALRDEGLLGSALLTGREGGREGGHRSEGGITVVMEGGTGATGGRTSVRATAQEYGGER